MRVCSLLASVAVILLFLADDARSQGRRPQGRSFGSPDRIALLRVEAVQKELALDEEQVAAVGKLSEELAAGRSGRGPGSRRGNSENLPEEERRKRSAQRRAEMEKRAEVEKEKLAAILNPKQVSRLNEIYLQARGTQALEDAEVAKQLGLKGKLRSKIRQTRQDALGDIRSKLREAFQSGDRDLVREKMAELRADADKKVLSLLSEEQKAALEKLKGTPFQLPEGALGGQGQGGRRRAGAGGN